MSSSKQETVIEAMAALFESGNKASVKAGNANFYDILATMCHRTLIEREYVDSTSDGGRSQMFAAIVHLLIPIRNWFEQQASRGSAETKTALQDMILLPKLVPFPNMEVASTELANISKQDLVDIVMYRIQWPITNRLFKTYMYENNITDIKELIASVDANKETLRVAFTFAHHRPSTWSELKGFAFEYIELYTDFFENLSQTVREAFFGKREPVRSSGSEYHSDSRWSKGGAAAAAATGSGSSHPRHGAARAYVPFGASPGEAWAPPRPPASAHGATSSTSRGTSPGPRGRPMERDKPTPERPSRPAAQSASPFASATSHHSSAREAAAAAPTRRPARSSTSSATEPSVARGSTLASSVSQLRSAPAPAPATGAASVAPAHIAPAAASGGPSARAWALSAAASVPPAHSAPEAVSGGPSAAAAQTEHAPSPPTSKPPGEDGPDHSRTMSPPARDITHEHGHGREQSHSKNLGTFPFLLTDLSTGRAYGLSQEQVDYMRDYFS